MRNQAFCVIQANTRLAMRLQRFKTPDASSRQCSIKLRVYRDKHVLSEQEIINNATSTNDIIGRFNAS